jgi:phytoene dehydrogenase-like protein
MPDSVASKPSVLAFEEHFDDLVIGCGMSGLGAGIRLAMFGRKVLIVDRHNAPGGLNGFYFMAGRNLDVGLHAVTNYSAPGSRGPLNRICRQLRIKPEEFKLSPQIASRIRFADCELRFANGLELLESEIARVFPQNIDAFCAFAKKIAEYDALDISRPSSGMARKVVHEALGDPLLAEMILCPLFFYGSASENDIDFDQFCILFRALYMEGFARPYEGVRRIIGTLLDRYRANGGIRRMKCGVRRLVGEGGRIVRAEMDDGSVVTADNVISSVGADETFALVDGNKSRVNCAPRLGFAEYIAYFAAKPRDFGWGDTIVFYCDTPEVDYRIPDSLVDVKSGVICFPNNYDYGGRELDEGIIRVTSLANYNLWKSLSKVGYEASKYECARLMLDSALNHLPKSAFDASRIAFSDTFTPLTVERFTGHFGGSIYGSPLKQRDGKTSYENLFICGTDQGFLGITGAILGGISMANLHVLQGK